MLAMKRHPEGSGTSKELGQLTRAITALTKAIAPCGLLLWDWCFPTRGYFAQINNKLDTTMSKVSEFVTAQKAFNDRLDTAVTGLTGDIAALNAKITELQNTSGEITAEDQALLDELQARAQGVAEKLEALDAITAPVVPTTP